MYSLTSHFADYPELLNSPKTREILTVSDENDLTHIFLSTSAKTSSKGAERPAPYSSCDQPEEPVCDESKRHV